MNKPVRIEISDWEAVSYYNAVNPGYPVETARQVYEKMGCGRACFGIRTSQLKDHHKEHLLKEGCTDINVDGVVFVCDKEVLPPVFSIGDF